MRTFGRHSILVRSASVLLASFFLAGALTIAATILVTGERQHKAATQHLEQLLDTVESTVSVACFVKDAQLADEVALGLLKNQEVLSVVIEADGADLVQRSQPGAPSGTATADYPHLSRDVYSPFNPGKRIGRIQVAANARAIQRATYDEVRFVILQTLGQLGLVALAVIAVMLIFIVRPIKAMSDGLHHLDATRGERLAVPTNHGDTEIGRLVQDINNLAGDLADTLGQERRLRLAKEVEERKYHSIFENAETGIFIAAQDGILNSWNPAFARLLGIPANSDFQGVLNIRQLAWENTSRVVELGLNARLDNVGVSDDLAIRPRGGNRR
ncbi:PAS domain-containing protein [Parasulfuritortus cantonensis]|nr:PAS domain-containing protein [Parasulfuritortus cantonensis]